MGRPVVLSNGQMFVGLDEHGAVHDFYYPYVGLDNLNNARNSAHKIGVWVDGQFSWTDDDSWQISVVYEPGVMVSDVTMRSEALGITLQSNDFVDPEHNAFIRHITVMNMHDQQRDVRLFMHQVFQISRAGRADTALYVPDDNYVLDYKGRCCLLTAGRLDGEQDFDQYAVGSYGIEGKAGTFKDAEDGELSGNAVEHGGVDSVLRFRKEVAGNTSFVVDYWVVAADSQSDGLSIHEELHNFPMAGRLEQTREYWRKWLEPAAPKLSTMPERMREEVRTSLLIIKAHCDVRGSILASGDSSIFNYGRDYYCYCWPRDAAFGVWPLLKFGLYDEAQAFFEFARSTMHRDGYLMHKYQPDRAIGSTWHPLLHGRNRELAIQEDETAIVIFMLGEYHRLSGDTTFIDGYYDGFIEPCATFMTRFVDEATGLPHASYDLWEQKFQTSTFTVCTVIAGLEAASRLADAARRPDDSVRYRRAAEKMRDGLGALYHPDGYFRKGFLLQDNGDLAYDDTLDVSTLYGIVNFAGLPLQDARAESTYKRVVSDLWCTGPIGGVIRYPGDGYFRMKQQYPGNPWAICTLWLGECFELAGNHEQAKELVDWTLERALPSGAISEQFDPDSGEDVSVSPLVWSHAEFINAVVAIYKP
ncbi:MAG TPA: glycoside hydrolase family 15 protein [Candidatus Saccharimonadales bacterium]|nr:glycoside hydrolase family 15 protein [Candidatus Saccharimonadales bacterium]